ncbi:MAG: hypothetical protein G3M78_01270 [Candidatus Nitrohelix vancouverensis]|uniref:Uncharacterized protein n=1 Tax=Candidatus Nitrohelix vancouverensis TaxID=2705534 RepID=A0A7T0C075_9BACT|nr:MAG: hypothetical protein G3M78_01270 [Candidatus Nitrohelix vancouverensis]
MNKVMIEDNPQGFRKVNRAESHSFCRFVHLHREDLESVVDVFGRLGQVLLFCGDYEFSSLVSLQSKFGFYPERIRVSVFSKDRTEEDAPLADFSISGRGATIKISPRSEQCRVAFLEVCQLLNSRQSEWMSFAKVFFRAFFPFLFLHLVLVTLYVDISALSVYLAASVAALNAAAWFLLSPNKTSFFTLYHEHEASLWSQYKTNLILIISNIASAATASLLTWWLTK